MTAGGDRQSSRDFGRPDDWRRGVEIGYFRLLGHFPDVDHRHWDWTVMRCGIRRARSLPAGSLFDGSGRFGLERPLGNWTLLGKDRTHSGACDREARTDIRPLRRRDRLGDDGLRCRGVLSGGWLFGGLRPAALRCESIKKRNARGHQQGRHQNAGAQP